MFLMSKFFSLCFFYFIHEVYIISSRCASDFRSLSRISDSDELRAVLRDVPPNGSNGSHKQYLEVWKHHQLYQNYDLGALDVHGDVYTDGKSLFFSPSAYT